MQGIPTDRGGRGGRRIKPRRRFPAEVLSPAEVMPLIGAIKGPPATAARNRAVIALAMARACGSARSPVSRGTGPRTRQCYAIYLSA
jgi:hypothetical protein